MLWKLWLETNVTWVILKKETKQNKQKYNRNTCLWWRFIVVVGFWRGRSTY